MGGVQDGSRWYLCGPWKKDRSGRAMRAEDVEQAMKGTYLLRGPERG
jgi:hypothetical protein